MLRACAPILRTLLFRRAALMSVGSVRYKVYTKTGDGGSTSLYSGERRKKDDAFFHALGDVDELNAAIGLSREHCAPLGGELVGQLVEIQSRLLDAGSAIATPATSSRPEQLARAAFDTAITAHLEAWIDAMEEALPPLKNFILPVRFARPAQPRCRCAARPPAKKLTHRTPPGRLHVFPPPPPSRAALRPPTCTLRAPCAGGPSGGQCRCRRMGSWRPRWWCSSTA